MKYLFCEIGFDLKNFSLFLHRGARCSPEIIVSSSLIVVLGIPLCSDFSVNI